MTPIRVNVQLINTTDEALIARGFLVPHLLRSLEAEALIDTRALALVIPPALVEPLGLRIRRRDIVYDANGGEEEVGVTEGVRIYCQGRETMVEAVVTGNEVIIGRIVLALMDLVVEHKNHLLVPNPANPDYPVARI